MKLPCNFGEYVLEEMLGQGGMGNVYQATRKRDGLTVAIKTVHPHLSNLKEFIGRFHREAKLLEKLAHPRVVRIFESGTVENEDEGTTHYIAMECVTGSKLSEVIEGKCGPVDTSKMTLSVKLDGQDQTIIPADGLSHILRQIAAVLQEAQLLGVVHRDIKPDNIIVTSPAWDVKLLDFGIARDSRDLQMSVSQTGNVLGTPPYMSPEQCRGETDIDIRSDLYALGVVAYQCLTGAMPFGGPTTMAFIQQHLHTNPPPLRTSNPSLPENLCQVIERMLAKERELRHQKPDELIEDLNRVKRGWAPLKIYSFDNRTLSETSAEGGEQIIPVSHNVILKDSTPISVAASKSPSSEKAIKGKKPLLPKTVGLINKKRSLLPLYVILLLAVAVAAYLIYAGLEKYKQPEQPIASLSPVKKAPKPHEQPEPVKESWREEWEKLINEGDKFSADGKYEDALNSYEKALALHSEAGLEKKKENAASKWVEEVTEEIDKVINDSPIEASQLLEKYKEIFPEDKYFLLDKQIKDRIKFQDLVVKGDKNSGSGDYDASIPLYEEALKIQHDDNVLLKLQQAKQEKSKADERLKIKKNYDACLRKGDNAFDNGDWKTSKEEYEKSLSFANELEEKEAINNISAKIARAEELIVVEERLSKARKEHDYNTEILVLKKGLAECDFAPYKTRLAEVERLAILENTMNAAEEKRNWQEMKKVAEELARAGNPKATGALQKAEKEIHFIDLYNKAREAENRKDYQGAIDYILKAKRIKYDFSLNTWERRLRSKRDEEKNDRDFEDAVRNSMLALKEGKPEKALEEAKKALGIRPEDKTVKDLFRSATIAASLKKSQPEKRTPVKKLETYRKPERVTDAKPHYWDIHTQYMPLALGLYSKIKSSPVGAGLSYGYAHSKHMELITLNMIWAKTEVTDYNRWLIGQEEYIDANVFHCTLKYHHVFFPPGVEAEKELSAFGWLLGGGLSYEDIEIKTTPSVYPVDSDDEWYESGAAIVIFDGAIGYFSRGFTGRLGLRLSAGRNLVGALYLTLGFSW